MPRTPVRNGNGAPRNGASKYDAHHKVLSQTYGAFADLRRELSDSKTTVSEREDILRTFAACPDSQRAWLALEDYFEKLSLSRRDFPATDWWPKMLAAQGKPRPGGTGFSVFARQALRAAGIAAAREPGPFCPGRGRRAGIAAGARTGKLAVPAPPLHLDTPRATLRVVCQPQPDEQEPSRYRLAVHFFLLRPRTGEKARSLHDLVDLVVRAAHEQELFTPWDWEFIQWIYDTHRERAGHETTLLLADAGTAPMAGALGPHQPSGIGREWQTAPFSRPCGGADAASGKWRQGTFLHAPHRLAGRRAPFRGATRNFSTASRRVALVGNEFFLLRNAPPNGVLKYLAQKPSVPVRKLSHRLLLHLRKTQANHGVDWEQLCVAHPAAPQFVFELLDDTVQLRLLAQSLRDKSTWVWNGHEWVAAQPRASSPGEKPEILDDPRLDPAVQWLRKLDWFMQEPGLWIGDANENFLGSLAEAWATSPGRRNFWATPRSIACSSRRAR